jgi:hypothetical protein
VDGRLGIAKMKKGNHSINMSGKMEIFVPEIGRKCILGRIWGLILLRIG